MKVYTEEAVARNLLTNRNDFSEYRFIAGEGVENPLAILVRGIPTWGDLKARKLFMGSDGIAVRTAMVQEGISIYTTAAFPFILPNRTPSLDEARSFATGYLRELRTLECDKLILFGADAVKLSPFLDLPRGSFNDHKWKTFDTGEFKVKIVPHAQILSNSPQEYRRFIEEVREFVWPKTLPPSKIESQSYFVHTDKKRARGILHSMPLKNVVCDIETTGLDPYSTKILTIQFSWKEGVGHSFPWSLFTRKEWQSFLDSRSFIFQNGSFDTKVLSNHGIQVKIEEDTMLMHSLVDETPGTHSMDAMALKYLGAEKWSATINYESMESNDLKTLGEYGARDADLTLRLANLFRPMVQGRPINQILHAAQNELVKAELRGVKINRELAHEFTLQIAGHLSDKSQMLADVYGLQNANSPKQVAEVLYGKLGLPPQKLKGKITTNEASLMDLQERYNPPIIPHILEYRRLTKAKGTYLQNILEASDRDGRYHPDFKLAATETGRLAESLILLIPRPGYGDIEDLGLRYQARLRELFVADEGYVMIGADYAGLEVAMAAYLTKDPQLIEDVKQKLDTHSAVAIQAFKLPVSLEPYDTLKKRVTAKYDHLRNLAKQGTFTWLYGGSEGAIARQLVVEPKVARAILSALRARYPGVAAWHDMVKEQVQRAEFVSTPWGRTRRFFFHRGLERKITEEQLRESINAPIQGMSSDMTLAAFVKLSRDGLQTLFPLHDAIYMQVPENRIEKGVFRIRDAMERVLYSSVPFRVDVKTGRNWGQLG